MIKRILFSTLFICAAVIAAAQGVKPLPALHVDGKWLVDTHGNHVVLHGVMDTPNTYFNNNRWQGSKAQGWWDDYNDTGVKNCQLYFEKLFTGLEKAKCNVFRLHMDPAWSNDPNKQSDGKESGEADISRFSQDRYKKFLKDLFVPLAQRAMRHGMYVVVRPPGVCPGNLKVNDYYQNYLTEVWDLFSKNDTIRKYAGQISIELANEPVNLRNASGNDDAKAMRDYFQPIINRIRANGFTGIIWVPGTGWQSQYANYKAYPVKSYNIGYAVHDYDGWYGCEDKKLTTANVEQAKKDKINQFRRQVPVVDTNPIIITEIDWSPKKPGSGHYNEHNEWVESNYGTWATGRTSMWGTVTKAVHDHYGNISMTLSGTACLIDVDTLIHKNGKVVPAFGGLEEACGKACMDWYAEYYEKNWPHADNEPSTEGHLVAEQLKAEAEELEIMVHGSTMPRLVATFRDGHQRDVAMVASYETDAPDVVAIDKVGNLRGLSEGEANITATYTDPQGGTVKTTFKVRSTFFPLDMQYIDFTMGSRGSYNINNHIIRPGEGGQVGWVYDAYTDFSAYRYLVVKLRQKQTCDAHLNIYTATSLAGSCYSSDKFGDNTKIVIDLQNAKYTQGKKGAALEQNKVRKVTFWGKGTGMIVLEDVYLTNNDDYSKPDPTAIEPILVQPDTNGSPAYNLRGQQVDDNYRGIVIRNGKKYFRK